MSVFTVYVPLVGDCFLDREQQHCSARQGFRRYLRIRETLCHELAHMVWGEHDNNFKELNSQLLRECDAADWVSRPGTYLRPIMRLMHGLSVSDVLPGCMVL